MSIENEALEHVGKFMDSQYTTLKYSDDVRALKPNSRSYIPKEPSVKKTPATDLYEMILKFKRGDVPSHLTDEDKKLLAEDLEVFTMSPKLSTKEGQTAFSFTMAKHYELQQKIVEVKLAKEAAKKVA